MQQMLFQELKYLVEQIFDNARTEWVSYFYLKW